MIIIMTLFFLSLDNIINMFPNLSGALCFSSSGVIHAKFGFLCSINRLTDYKKHTPQYLLIVKLVRCMIFDIKKPS